MILSNNAASRVVKIVPSDNVPMLIALGRIPCSRNGPAPARCMAWSI